MSMERPHRLPLPPPRCVDAGGWRLRYREMGSGDPPLVLIHGLGGDCNAWALNHAALAADRRVLAVELPGHGGSEKEVGDGSRSEERRVGKECVSTCRSRWSPYH